MSQPHPPAADLPWDELPVGLSRSLSTRITPDDVLAFARLSGDYSPIHIDDGEARQRGLPGMIAHGALLAARVSTLVGMALPGRRGVMQGIELQFRHPLVPPADITVTATIAARSDAVRQLRIQIEIHHDHRVIATGKVLSVVRD